MRSYQAISYLFKGMKGKPGIKKARKALHFSKRQLPDALRIYSLINPVKLAKSNRNLNI